ncbi:hypothetical protein [Mycoplasma phocoenae]|uniref:Glycosyltransferase n=1 Tax=Mycoplasma phocoenae TaxID=754517 RepID=A0A858U675_9MOLU|nr:hypothetical protein [Mycoplasma phocoenae]QJG66733.1 hypothetical protein HGG69_00075 [Mycoplasma phocoenae]
MKLNFIIPVSNSDVTINEIIRNLARQKNQYFDISIIIDKPNDLFLEQIFAAKKLFKGSRFKLIFNSKRQSMNQTIAKVLEESKSLYTHIFTPGVDIENDWTETILKIIDSQSPDIIETRANYRGMIKYDEPIIKIETNKLIELKTNNKPIAYSSPILFNKVFKTRLLKSIYSNPLLKSNNKQYSVDIIYTAFLNTETYYLVDSIVTRDWNYNITNFNVLNFVKEWNYIKSIMPCETKTQNDLYQFIKFYHYQIFLAGNLGHISHWKMMIYGKKINTTSIENQLVNELNKMYSDFESLSNNMFLKSTIFYDFLDEQYINIDNWKYILDKII